MENNEVIEGNEINEIIEINEVIEGNGSNDEASRSAGTAEYGERLSGISNELSLLKEAVNRINAGERISSSIRELISLIPDADISLLDGEALDAIGRGENLTYAYLLSERRRMQAEITNKRNSLSSSGEAHGGKDQLYSIEEIKRMDRRTVKKNLDKVLRSLEKAGNA